MERPAHWGREKKNCSSSSAIISYQPIQTTSPTARAACVWEVVCVCMGERERERNREQEQGRGRLHILSPPSSSNHRKEGPERKLPIKSARGSRHYLSNKLLTDYMSRSLVLDWRNPSFFSSSYFFALFPPSASSHLNDFLTRVWVILWKLHVWEDLTSTSLNMVSTLLHFSSLFILSDVFY